MEKEAWDLVGGILTPPQAQHLRDVITTWREQHPHVRAVGGVRFADFAKSASESGDVTRGGLFSMLGLDPFAKLDPAVREIAQTRQLAERAIFYLQRAPALLNMQLERFADQITTMDETKSLLNSVQRASLLGSAADQLANSFPQVIATERQALMSQLDQTLTKQRGAISELKATLQTGTETATAIDSMLQTLDQLTAQLTSLNSKSKDNARPFDIREYTETVRELADATREINSLAQHIDTAIPVVHAAGNELTVGLQAVLDRAVRQLLWLIVAAILGVFIAALAYRFIVSRLHMGTS
jgi:flagellar biosynthesis chaperone FliJ